MDVKTPLPVLYKDEDIAVVHKPSGLLVHRTALDRRETTAAVQLLRTELDQMVYPVHRLDRATSGVLIFALNVKAAQHLSANFSDGGVHKVYLAIVRGTPPPQATIEYPLSRQNQSSSKLLGTQAAVTRITTLATHEFPVQVDKYPTSRYSLVRAEPQTGRQHQIRRHLARLGHPIVGDVEYGKGKHNRFFRSQLNSHRLLLACTEMSFPHPQHSKIITVRAPLAPEYFDVLKALGWNQHVN